MTFDTIAALPTQHPDDVYAMPQDDVAELQLNGIRHRFAELRPKIRALDVLATDLGVGDITSIDDVIPLCFPHTMYKSYSAKHVELGRYDRLTGWLGGLTTIDVSDVDSSQADSLEAWLDAVESATALRPLVSSGTTGKISLYPRSTVEADIFVRFVVQSLKGFHDEQDARLADGEADFFIPVPMATGRQNMPRLFELMRQHCYGGDATRIHTLGRGHWDADMLWLWGKMRQSERRPEDGPLELTPALERVRDRVLRAQQEAASHRDRFLEELLAAFDGAAPVILFAPLAQLIDLASLCREQGWVPEPGPDRFILTGGGTKGMTFPDGWEELLHSVFPPPYHEWYAMTESSAISRLCMEGWFHWPPTIVPFLLDPDTSEPLPRTGKQTGRFALFDLAPVTHWGGAISGDRVTIDWTGGCSCGRTGPRIRNDITRFSDLRDDDKITCAKSPGAYDRAVDSIIDLA